MADVALREVLQAAQDDLEGGAPRSAIVACGRVLRHYPEALTALRLLGEAHLELGQADEAREHFDRALALDPYNLPSRIGLAVLAEDRGDLEGARAQFRLAMEIAPALPRLRGELARLARRPAGMDGRPRLTRIALANLHARNEELPRAIRQFRLVLAEQPARPDLPLGLAQALWRRGAAAEAAVLCRQILDERPRTVRAALLLAAIAGDGGAPADATESARCLLAAREGDPDAALARELVALRPSGTLAEFISESHTILAPDPASPVEELEDRVLAQGFAAGVTAPLRLDDPAPASAESAPAPDADETVPFVTFAPEPDEAVIHLPAPRGAVEDTGPFGDEPAAGAAPPDLPHTGTATPPVPSGIAAEIGDAGAQPDEPRMVRSAEDRPADPIGAGLARVPGGPEPAVPVADEPHAPRSSGSEGAVVFAPHGPGLSRDEPAPEPPLADAEAVAAGDAPAAPEVAERAVVEAGPLTPSTAEEVAHVAPPAEWSAGPMVGVTTPAPEPGMPIDRGAPPEALAPADPPDGPARLALAAAYGAERPEQALDEYRRLLKESDDLAPEIVERLRGLIAVGAGGARAHRLLGDAYMKLGQFDLAMAEFQRALAARAKR